MKNPLKPLTALAILLVCSIPTTAMAASKWKVTVDHERLAALPMADQQRVLCIAERVSAIAAMDRGALDREERRALRSELNAMRSQADAYNRAAGGTVIYISGAGLILIIILLVILL